MISGLTALLAAATAAPPCMLPDGWAAVDGRHPHYVIFGETHGTEQAPAMVGQVACALARRGERLLVAIEQDADQNAALQKAWGADDRVFADALRRYPDWRGREDGVGSRAMFDLLLALHRLRAQGQTVDVVAFNADEDPAQLRRYADQPGQGPHEAGQAENIRTAAAAGDYDRVLILTGSLHAEKVSVTVGQVSVRPMAMQLAPAGRIVSLRMLSGAGTMWNCLPKPGYDFTAGRPLGRGAIDCSNHSAMAMASLGPTPLVRMGDPPGEVARAYDGYLWIGPITGSPPVELGEAK